MPVSAAQRRRTAEGTTRTHVDVLLVCSAGGHLLQLSLLGEAWRGLSHAWVTLEREDARTLLAGQTVFYASGPTTRNLPNLIRNLHLAWTLTRRLRPRVILTTGAAVAVPFAWVGKLVGARVVYIESLTRIEKPSVSCRLIKPVADRLYVQWPEPRRCAAAGPVRRQRVRAAVILVTTGTNGAPFDRLLREVESARRPEPVVVQHGPSPLRPANATCVDYVSYEELARLVQEARTVVAHGGVGSILVALANGKRPIVAPRLARFGEAVDDHQLELGRKLDAAGLVTLVEDPAQLAEHAGLQAAAGSIRGSAGPTSLVDDLRAYLVSLGVRPGPIAESA